VWLSQQVVKLYLVYDGELLGVTVGVIEGVVLFVGVIDGVTVIVGVIVSDGVGVGVCDGQVIVLQ